MKKLLQIVLLALFVLGLSASSAFAATMRVSVNNASAQKGTVVFNTRLSKAARIRVTVYRGRAAVKTIRTNRRAVRQSVTWNVRNSSTTAVPSGNYTYTVATITGASSRRSGKVRVTQPAPVVVALPAGTASRWVGVYQPGVPANLTDLITLESRVGTSAAVLNFFIADTESFPLGRVTTAAGHGSIPMVTLEFMSIQTGGLAALNNGSKDVYLGTFADAAKSYGGTVWLRPFHEMNGNWYPWAGTVGANSPAQLIAAWRHVHDIFVKHGATNVKFVWCVNNDSVPGTAENAISKYWPGDAYVDYTSVDLYNFGTYASWSHWTPFASAFAAPYAEITGLSGKPMFLSELGCVEQGGDKGVWIRDMFSSVRTKFTKVQGFVWFNALKGEDWRIESTQASVDAFKSQVALGF